jgi:hypothetical protein
MVTSAKRLQRTVPEQLRIAAVWHDVIGHGRGGDAPFLSAHGAKRVGVELHSGSPLRRGFVVPGLIPYTLASKPFVAFSGAMRGLFYGAPGIPPVFPSARLQHPSHVGDLIVPDLR